MSNQPPLNPDALEAASDTISDRYDGNGYEGTANEIAEDAIRAYLAVAQPVVNSVEELDALPNGTLVKSGGREFYKTSRIEYPWVLPYGVDRFGSSYLAKHSKVTVIRRPEVKP